MEYQPNYTLKDLLLYASLFPAMLAAGVLLVSTFEGILSRREVIGGIYLGLWIYLVIIIPLFFAKKRWQAVIGMIILSPLYFKAMMPLLAGMELEAIVAMFIWTVGFVGVIVGTNILHKFYNKWSMKTGLIIMISIALVSCLVIALVLLPKAHSQFQAEMINLQLHCEGHTMGYEELKEKCQLLKSHSSWGAQISACSSLYPPIAKTSGVYNKSDLFQEMTKTDEFFWGVHAPELCTYPKLLEPGFSRTVKTWVALPRYLLKDSFAVNNRDKIHKISEKATTANDCHKILKVHYFSQQSHISSFIRCMEDVARKATNIDDCSGLYSLKQSGEFYGPKWICYQTIAVKNKNPHDCLLLTPSMTLAQYYPSTCLINVAKESCQDIACANAIRDEYCPQIPAEMFKSKSCIEIFDQNIAQSFS